MKEKFRSRCGGRVQGQSTEQVPGQPSIGSERNHQNQKTSEDVIERRDHVPVLAHVKGRTPCGLIIHQPDSVRSKAKFSL